MPRIDVVEQVVAFFRTAGRLGVFVGLLVADAGMGEAAVLTWQSVLKAFLVSTVVLWFVTSVVAGAVARHAAPGVVVRMYPLLRTLYAMSWPLVWIGGRIDGLIRIVVRADPPHEVAEQELLHAIEDTERSGAVGSVEAAILENAVQFGEKVVGEIMTPRTLIEGIEYTDELPSIRRFIETAGHSRMPVFRGSIDQIAGILYLKDLIRFIGEDGESFRLQPLLRTPVRVPETQRVRDLLQQFQRTKVHMAIVVDEFGGTAGLVTIEDVVEELVGEIRDEHEPPEQGPPELRAVAPDAWEADARVEIGRLAEETGLEIPEDAEYGTVAALVLQHFGRIPARGDRFSALGAQFEVIAASPARVERVLIRVPRADGEQAPAG
jgi:CBS domain containing-hemolysin-like protein